MIFLRVHYIRSVNLCHQGAQAIGPLTNTGIERPESTERTDFVIGSVSAEVFRESGGAYTTPRGETARPKMLVAVKRVYEN